MSQDLLQELMDHRAICELKASFGRLADAKDWEGYRNIFSEDCEFDFGGDVIMQGSQAGSDAIAGMLTGAVSVHRAYMPEITFLSPTEAKGVWAVNDYIEWAADPETGSRAAQMGYGREYETYRKVDGKWKIAHWRLRYDRLDPVLRAASNDFPWRTGRHARRGIRQVRRQSTGHLTRPRLDISRPRRFCAAIVGQLPPAFFGSLN